MGSDKSYSNFTDLWKEVVETDSDKMLFRVPTQQAGQVLSFRVRAFLKRAAKIANVFRSSLKMKAGARVALLSQTPEDIGLILHGAWLARVVPVVIPPDLPDDSLVSVLKQTGTTAVIFPPESSARIASLFGKASQVEHWIASGKSGGNSSGSVTHKLEELALRADMDLPDFDKADEECEGLIVPTAGNTGKPSYVLFSQRALIEAGKAAASIHPEDPAVGRLYWCGLPFESFNALMHNCVAPLFSSLVAYVSTEVDLRSFWETAYADDLSFCVVLQEQLRTVYNRGKPRAWLKPDNFQIICYSNEPLSMALLTGFEERFLTSVYPCYSLVEAGGVISIFPYGESEEFRKEWLADFDLPSSGIPLSDIDFSITTGSGQELGEEYMGSVRIRSPRGISECVISGHDETTMQMGNLYASGDEGYWVKDDSGRKHLFVHGRTSDMILRDELRISPARANGVLAEIRGLEWARTLGFPNAAVGYEVGAYVIPRRVANLTEASVMAQLRARLDWDECPKVVIFGEHDSDGNYPSRKQIEAAFHDYYEIDYDFDRS